MKGAVMEQLVNLVRELCLCVLTLVRSLLIILLAAIVLTGYLLYLAAAWVAEHPVIWMALPTVFLSLLGLRRYVLGRHVMVEMDWAVIVKKAGGRFEPLYRGCHRLKIGDRVCKWLPLRPIYEKANLEEVYTCDEERVRLAAVYEQYISDPLRFYLLRRKRPVDFTELNRWALMCVVEGFGLDDLYNSPFEIDGMVAQTINNQIRERGLQVTNYRLDEAVWPETNERWRRNGSQLALRAGQYWSESGNLKRQLR
jgi:hypothetical protein